MSTGSLHEINAKKHKLKAGVLTAIITVCILVLCFTLTAFTILIHRQESSLCQLVLQI